MPVLRCTQKLLKELGVHPVEPIAPSGALASWHAKLLLFDRRKCVLLTNDQTLYSLFVPGLRKPQFRRFADVLGQALFRSLRLANLSPQQMEAALEDFHDANGVQIAKTNNRSVLGSMNDLAYQLEWIISSHGGLALSPIDEVNRHLNRIPMSALKPHTYSIEALRDTLSAHAT